jgi:hypothetical protein
MTIPDCDENTCANCKNVFYTPVFENVAKAITAPNYCPFCGIKFNYTKPTMEVLK